MSSSNVKLQERVLGLLADKIDDFYLAGGTALARYYFHHRLSEDLDFFTQEYDRTKITEAIGYLASKLRKRIKLTAEIRGESGKIKMVVYHIPCRGSSLKMDFVADYLELLKHCKKIDGIFVLSLEDIYLRKIYTLIGAMQEVDVIGRKISTGRQEAKDYYDLYFLSHTYRRLSDFVWEHCDAVEREALIHWYRTYDRMNIKTGLLDLKITKKHVLDSREIDDHFKKEIDQLLEKEIGKI